MSTSTTPEPERRWVWYEIIEATWPQGPTGPMVVRRWHQDDPQ